MLLKRPGSAARDRELVRPACLMPCVLQGVDSFTISVPGLRCRRGLYVCAMNMVGIISAALRQPRSAAIRPRPDPARANEWLVPFSPPPLWHRWSANAFRARAYRRLMLACTCTQNQLGATHTGADYISAARHMRSPRRSRARSRLHQFGAKLHIILILSASLSGGPHMARRFCPRLSA